MDQVLQTINKIVDSLAYKFTFSYHSVEDIKQQAKLYAWEAYTTSYDKTRPLEPFLYIHVKNRLCTFKRDTYERLNCPCLKCANWVNFECVKYESQNSCDKHYKWAKRNKIRKNVAVPFSLSDQGNDDFIAKKIDYTNLIAKIDEELPVNLRKDYLKLITYGKLPKPKRIKVQAAVLEIMEKYGYNTEKTWAVES